MNNTDLQTALDTALANIVHTMPDDASYKPEASELADIPTFIDASTSADTVNYFYDSKTGMFETGSSVILASWGARWCRSTADTLMIVDAGLTAQELDVIFNKSLFNS
tara:strand:- start:32616 stop:32939 length:324 start_codon:yes stop_codon:yes gene_type:complete